ncbi:4-diphosphocytidyl-2-C-methyl-D-erythritol kinase, chloroplastic/chromoplastic [Glycine soja]|nr:4-diphosphocytidyl-2-C-methyl-D-erythritol kinase, chloroplastic/chromoplastic [Glycine soja]
MAQVMDPLLERIASGDYVFLSTIHLLLYERRQHEVVNCEVEGAGAGASKKSFLNYMPQNFLYCSNSGCGSGLSGETISENGHHWIGLDILASMLNVAVEREIEGDLLLGDMGQGLGICPEVMDGAINISVVQALQTVGNSLNFNPSKVISLGDIIKFSLSPSKTKDSLSTNVSGVPLDDRNLIHLDKWVPTGAGLGGGSSNAATALWAANQFSGCPASEKELQEWSSEIGSDIPFFFSQGAAYYTGRGEVVQNIPPPVSLDVPMVLIKPPEACSTAEVYKPREVKQLLNLDEPPQMLRFFGIGYCSPILATAMSDLIPAFTFILAIVFRIKKLDWKTNSTWAKSIGTLVSIAGALIITLYKGQAVIKNHPSNKLFPKKHVSSEQFDWVLGAVLLAGHSFVLSLLFIVQTWIIRNYPTELVIVLTRSTLVAMLSIPPSLISVTDPKALRLGFDVNLIAIAFQAIFGVSLRSIVHIWVMSKKGPLYVAMVKSIGIIFAVIMGIAFLGDSIYLGRHTFLSCLNHMKNWSVLGAAIIWGKSQEQAKEECEVYDDSESYSPVVPLLKNKRMEE